MIRFIVRKLYIHNAQNKMKNRKRNILVIIQKGFKN